MASICGTSLLATAGLQLMLLCALDLPTLCNQVAQSSIAHGMEKSELWRCIACCGRMHELSAV